MEVRAWTRGEAWAESWSSEAYHEAVEFVRGLAAVGRPILWDATKL